MAHPILDILGWHPEWIDIHSNPFDPLGLLTFLLLELCLFSATWKTLSKLTVQFDALTRTALSFVLSHAWLIFILNALTWWIDLKYSTPLAYILSSLSLFSIGFLISQSTPSSTPHIDRLSLWTSFGIMAFSGWILLIGCGIDFGKVNLPQIGAISASGRLPGDIEFPLGRSFYHYGTNLYAAALVKGFGFKIWIAEDILPWILCWTPFAAFRQICLNFFPSLQVRAWAIGLLSFFGTNIKIYFSLILFLIALFGGSLQQDSQSSLNSIRLLTNDFNLSPSTALTHIEQLLHAPSALGLPIFLMTFVILSSSLNLKPKWLVFGLLMAAQPLMREDLWCLSLLAAGATLVIDRNYSKLIPWAVGGVLILFAFSQGGPFSSPLIQNLKPKSKIISKPQQKVAAQQLNDFDFLKPKGQNLTLTPPSLASLSIQKGKQKSSLFHPQIVLDLILDYGPSLLGILCIPLLILKYPKAIILILPFCAAWAVQIFCDLKLYSYKIDLQRFAPYGFTTFCLLIALCYQRPIRHMKRWVLIFCLSGLVAGLTVPQRHASAWHWWHKDFRDLHQALPQLLNQYDPNLKIVFVGLNRGLTNGYYSTHYLFDHRLDDYQKEFDEKTLKFEKNISDLILFVTKKTILGDGIKKVNVLWEGQDFVCYHDPSF